MSSGITRDEWLAALEHAGMGTPVDDREAVTAIEFESLMGLGRTRAKTVLQSLVEKGLATRTTKLYKRSDGKLHYMTAYRLKKTPKKKR